MQVLLAQIYAFLDWAPSLPLEVEVVRGLDHSGDYYLEMGERGFSHKIEVQQTRHGANFQEVLCHEIVHALQVEREGPAACWSRGWVDIDSKDYWEDKDELEARELALQFVLNSI